ncbi:MAG: hypothetical protein BRC53_15985, partial [Cyanobacteria bacterium SW_6_48_11]
MPPKRHPPRLNHPPSKPRVLPRYQNRHKVPCSASSLIALPVRFAGANLRQTPPRLPPWLKRSLSRAPL